MILLLTVLLCAAGADTAPVAADRQFEVTASRFKFEPDTLEVTEGDRVLVIIRSTDVEHGFAIKKLKVKAEIGKTGDPVRVEFVARKAGTYEISCTEYCGMGHSRMKGKLVVAPRATVGDKQ
jgi:cytochrome c oxidase subunit 2